MRSSEAETTVVVFARAPEPGHAKTRLIPALGPEGAALLQARLTRRALETAVAAQVGPVELWCAPHALYPFFEDCARHFPVRLRGQGPGSLGEKMLRACREVLTRSPGVILIGTDCPALSPEHLAAAADVLASFREGYGFETTIKSDIAPLNNLMETLLSEGGIVTAKDPTRGGLANTVNEFSEKSNQRILLNEDAIPIPGGVRSACSILGIDPLEIGNEGKVVLGVIKEKADAVLAVLRKHPLGKHAAIIGEATDRVSAVVMETTVGGKRIVRKPLGDPIPRIC